jgi:hypothetical protein
MIKHVIAIYPGRFQPFGKHHAAAFKWLQKEFGQGNAYIVTSDKVDPPKSPFNFKEKQEIISHYGFNNLVQVKNPYKAEELMSNFNPEDTAVVFMVGEKDMLEDPRFKIGTKKDGSPSYFQNYKENKGNLQGFDKHGYLITAPHVSIAIPGYGEMSGTELRNVLGTKTVSREEKAKAFKDIFGWYDKKTADMIFDKLEPLTESVFTKDWWKNIFETLDPKSKNSLTEENIFTLVKSKFKDFISKLKQEGSETKQAFLKLIKAAKGDVTLTDKEKEEIGEQLKDTLKLAGLTAIAIAPGGVIVGALLKLLKQEHLVTPSAFVNEVGEANAKVYPFSSNKSLKQIMDKAIDFKNHDHIYPYYSDNILYTFDTENARYLVEILIDMEIMSNKNSTNNPNEKSEPLYNTTVQVIFTTEGNPGDDATNLNEQYSVLSTITKIILEFVERFNKEGGNIISVQIAPKDDTSKLSKIDSKRGKFYTAYIKKNLSKVPGYSIREKTNYEGHEYIEIYKKNNVNEVGEATASKYKWEETSKKGNYYQVKFTTDIGTQYEVDLVPTSYIDNDSHSSINALLIEFGAKLNDSDGYSDKAVVNKGEIYKVMSTIVDIVKKYTKKLKANAILYSPSKKQGEEFGTQRDQLYKAFISKAIPGVKFEQKRDLVAAILPDTQINEVGEATASKYKWEEIDREGYFIYVGFETESETTYFVDLGTDKYKGVPVFNVEFAARTKGAEGSSSKVVVNKGEMYKVMATITDIIKTYLKKFKKVKGIVYYPSKKGNESFGTQRDKLYKAFITKAIPGIKFEPINSALYDDGMVALMPDAIVKEAGTRLDPSCWDGYKIGNPKTKISPKTGKRVNNCVKEGFMGAEQTKKHNAKLEKLKKFLDDNRGREFVYNFDMFPKTVVGVGLQEGLIREGGAAGHMQHPFNIDWVKNGKDLLEVFKMATEYLKNGPGAVKIDGLNASIRLIELDGKKQFVLDRGSQKDLDVRGITKADLLNRFGEGHGMIQVGGKVLDIFNASLNATTAELKQMGLWNDPNIMFNLEYVSGTSNVIEYGNNFLAIHGLLEITRQTNAKTGKPGARTTTEIPYNEDVMQRYIDKLAVFAQKEGYEVVGSVPTEMKSEPNFTKVLSEKITINYGNGKEATKPLSQWLSMIKVPEDQTIKLTDGKTVNALSKAVLNAVLEGTPLNEFVADIKDIPLAIDGAITYIATAKLGDEVLKNLQSKLGPVSDHEGVVIRDERISDKPFKITGQFIITGQTSQFQKK